MTFLQGQKFRNKLSKVNQLDNTISYNKNPLFNENEIRFRALVYHNPIFETLPEAKFQNHESPPNFKTMNSKHKK